MTHDDLLKTTITRQIQAIACERLIVTVTKPKLDANGEQIYMILKDKAGNPRLDRHGQPILKPVMITINLCRPGGKGTPQTPWTLDDLLDDDNLKKIKGFNARGFAVYITPQEQGTNQIYLLVDDFQPSLLDVFGAPNSLCQTSPASRQAVYVVPFDHDRRLYVDVFNYLNLAHGDPKISGLRHPFRLAGFSNQKEKYRNEDGKFPFVKLVSGRKAVSPAMLAFVEECASGLFPHLDEDARLRKERDAPDLDEDDDEEMQEPKAQAQPPAQAVELARPRTGISAVDHRGEDYSETLRAAWHGVEGEDLERFVAEISKHIPECCGYDTNPQEYIRKTAANAQAAVAVAREKIEEERASRKPAPPVVPRANNRPTVARYAEMARLRREAAQALKA